MSSDVSNAEYGDDSRFDAGGNYYTGHVNFTDYSTMQYQPAFKSYLQDNKYVGNFSNIGTAEGTHIDILINSYVLQRVNRYLKEMPSNTYDH